MEERDGQNFNSLNKNHQLAATLESVEAGSSGVTNCSGVTFPSMNFRSQRKNWPGLLGATALHCETINSETGCSPIVPWPAAGAALWPLCSWLLAAAMPSLFGGPLPPAAKAWRREPTVPQERLSEKGCEGRQMRRSLSFDITVFSVCRI